MIKLLKIESSFENITKIIFHLKKKKEFFN